jgi:hypothetical protein
MLTQPLPYSPAAATYEPITPAEKPTFPMPTPLSSRKFSFHSVKSNASTSTTSTLRSTFSKKSLRLKARLHSLLKPCSTTSRRTSTEGMSGSEVGSATVQKAQKANRVEGNPDADKMFTWAALGVYAYPGAGPLAAWF